MDNLQSGTLFVVLLQLNSGALLRWDGPVAGCVLSLLLRSSVLVATNHEMAA